MYDNHVSKFSLTLLLLALCAGFASAGGVRVGAAFQAQYYSVPVQTFSVQQAYVPQVYAPPVQVIRQRTIVKQQVFQQPVYTPSYVQQAAFAPVGYGIQGGVGISRGFGLNIGFQRGFGIGGVGVSRGFSFGIGRGVGFGVGAGIGFSPQRVFVPGVGFVIVR